MSFNRSILLLAFAVAFTVGCVRGVEVDFSSLSAPKDAGLKDKDAGSRATDGGHEKSDGDASLSPYSEDSTVPPDTSTCGNRVVESKETCDDGNDVSDDGCSRYCEVETGFACPAAGGACEACGNGKTEGTEACDDGNLKSGDGCNEFCKTEAGFTCLAAGSPCEACGNGVFGLGEVCDDGNRNSGDGCNESCTFVEPRYACPEPNVPCEKCGNGIIDKHEVCDDGNAASGDGCNAFCAATENGFVCETAGMACRPKCGDSFVVGDETCDDGNDTLGDGCDGNCRLEAAWKCPNTGIRCIANACGDGLIAGDEQCEDGNANPNDGCDAACRLEDGYVCKTVGGPCTSTVCNDRIKEGSEPCDDGNNVIGDGCNPFCEVEPTCAQDGCKSSCGDGMILATDNEECDDGNTLNNDGCSSDCKTEPGYQCTVVASQLPNKILVPITYRDFISFPINGGVRHPDFQAYGGEYTTPALVTDTLGSDGKPVYSGICDEDLAGATLTCPYRRQTTTEADFNQWYRDTSGVNITSVQKLPLNTRFDGSYSYPSTVLFPLDGAGWVSLGSEGTSPANVWNATENKYVSDAVDHNFGFTSELRYWFEFKGGESLTFTGDDDVWVFINRKLALDLGGLHQQRQGKITIDNAGVCSWSRSASGGQVTGSVDLALTAGKIYEIALFHAERHTWASNFHLMIKGFVKARSSCTTVCGNGVVTRDELCDNGINDGSYGGCMPNCLQRGPFCGDGKVDLPKEKCDDGVRNGGNGGYNQCAPGCIVGPHCGDGHKDIGHEQCDDNNLMDGDGCNFQCGLERCGNGLVEAGEQCDDGNATAGDGCSPRCDREICGNGWLDPGEACDDGNTLDGDGCGADCRGNVVIE